MEQTIGAMVTILGQIRSQDFFTIISFATDITVWEVDQSAIVKASPDNISKAVKHVELLEAAGETNINEALIRSLTILDNVKENRVLKDVQPMVFFLTDGHPTVGVTDTQEILENVRSVNSFVQAPIFSLAFGRKTDFQMLRLLSLQNYGFARKIYPASDASLQLEGLYNEVSSPLLANVSFKYLDPSVVTQSLTDTVFHTFYQGGEMVVAGMVDTTVMNPLIQYEITAHQADGQYKVSGYRTETVEPSITLLPSANITNNRHFMERLWAYLSVKALLRKVELGELYSCHHQIRNTSSSSSSIDPDMCDNLERALFLSLKYNFVTPLTSLVVVKPHSVENGDIAEADMFNKKIRVLRGKGSRSRADVLVMLLVMVMGTGDT